MKLSVCAVTVYGDLKLTERAEAIMRHGISNIELWGLTGLDIDELEKSSKAVGWRAAGFCGNQDNALIDPEKRQGFMAELRRSVGVAKRLGSSNIAVLTDQMDPQARPIPPTRPMSRDQKLLSYYEGLSQAVRLAEDEDVNLLIEPLNTKVDHQGYFLSNTAMGFEIIRGINSPRLKMLYDSYHMQIMEGNLIKTIEQNLDAISEIHVADVPGRHEPGTGEVNYRNIIRMLKANGYKGYIGLECWPAEDSDKAIKAFLELFD
jgi:hydroxypyruvate isomerase